MINFWLRVPCTSVLSSTHTFVLRYTLSVLSTYLAIRLVVERIHIMQNGICHISLQEVDAKSTSHIIFEENLLVSKLGMVRSLSSWSYN